MKTFRSSFIFITLLSVLSGCFAFKSADQTTQYHFVSTQGQASPQVLQILTLTDIDHDGSLSDIVKQTQKAWLRKPGTERWQLEKLITEHDGKLKKLFHDLGMYQEIKPIEKDYSYLLMLGALFKTMDRRFTYAIDLYKSGIRFEKIVLLAGARPAVADQGENLEAFLAYSDQNSLDKIPQTEAEMLQFVYDHADMPEAMKKIPVQIINVPMLATDSGSLRRPTTADTIAWWLKTNPPHGNCLAISNQPYVAYQQSVLKTLLPSDLPAETVGAACNQKEELANLLDTLARILYQEMQRLQKNK